MRKIKVVVLLVQQLQHGFTKNAKVSPNLTVAHYSPIFDRCSTDAMKNTYTFKLSGVDTGTLTVRKQKYTV